MNELVAGEADVVTGRGFFDFLSEYVGTVGETIQTGIETAGETVQAFPGAVADLGPEEVTLAPTYAPVGQSSMLPLGIAAVAGLGVAYWLSTR